MFHQLRLLIGRKFGIKSARFKIGRNDNWNCKIPPMNLTKEQVEKLAGLRC